MVLNSFDDIDEIDSLDDIKKLEQIDTDFYDIYLIDIDLNNLSNETGLQLAEKLIDKKGDIKIAILTGHLKKIYKWISEKIGVKAFIDKNISPTELLQILKKIYKGEKYFKKFKDEINNKDILTCSEVKILDLLRKGDNIDEIAHKIFISKRTVYNHLDNIYSKLKVHNREEAIYKAEKLGYFLDF